MDDFGLENRINRSLKSDIPFKSISLFWYEQLTILELLAVVNDIMNDYEFTDDPVRCSIDINSVNKLMNLYNKLVDGPQKG